MKSDQEIGKEMEKKYLIKGKETFNELLGLITPLKNINDYSLGEFSSKKREYRYFDTFEGRLAEGRILTYVGPLEKEGASTSFRARGGDYVLTVKIPTEDPEERKEHEKEKGQQFPLLDMEDFYQLNPEEFARGWGPLKRIKEICGDRPLQEAVRLEVQTNRFDLYKNNKRKVEIAIDDVLGKGPYNIQTRFHELEIECKEGTKKDIEEIIFFFINKYPSQFIYSLVPKWIKALRLIRGEKLEDLETKAD